MSASWPLAVVADADRIPFPHAAVELLARAGVNVLVADGHDVETLTRNGSRAAALLVRHGRWGAAQLAHFPDLRVITRCGTGYDNIDIAAARARGIDVTYVPAYGVDDVADQALALALALLRRIPAGDLALRNGQWPGADAYRGVRRLRGRTVGVVGYGRIGRAVATRFAAFGTTILAHDPQPVTDATAVPLRRLLTGSDIVCLTCPLTADTRGLLGPAELALLRPDAVLVNVARGELVDEAALADALDNGRIGGASLDVYAHEPLPQHSPLLRSDRVVLAPHSAAFTDDAITELALAAAADVAAVLNGQPPKYPVR